MLRSVRGIENIRLRSADGTRCGSIKDLYFDDQTWAIRYAAASLSPRQFGNRRLVIPVEYLSSAEDDPRLMEVSLPMDQLATLPSSTAVLPVCKQYASLMLSSPGAASFKGNWLGADPHLRSTKAVLSYRILVESEYAGALGDLLLDAASWEIRYLVVEQAMERNKVRFHVLPQSVERLTWVTQRIILRDLAPVQLASEVPINTGNLAA